MQSPASLHKRIITSSMNNISCKAHLILAKTESPQGWEEIKRVTWELRNPFLQQSQKRPTGIGRTRRSNFPILQGQSSLSPPLTVIWGS